MASALLRTCWCVLLSLLGALPLQARAQFAAEPPSTIWLRALLDVRLAGGGPAPSWTEHGPGKLRYGGSDTSGSFQSSEHFGLSRAALQVGAALPWDIRGQVQLDVQPDIADGYHPWLTEAILRKEWGEGAGGWGVQSGIMHVPFSLENVGPAWSPEYSISSSLLNSWIWEDILLSGAEGEWWHTTQSGLRLGVLIGGGYGTDQIGRLLALRGWVMGDTIGGINGSLALPGGGARTDIFNERDHRPALYSWLSLGDEAEVASVRFGAIDNQGDEGRPGVWHTRFATVGLVVHPIPRVDVIAQYLDGVARVHAPANDSSFSASYALLSYHIRQHRLSVRYDSFRVHDLDGGPISTSEQGHAVTTAYLLQRGLRHRIALEHTWMTSHRVATGPINPTPDGWQVSYRFRY